MKILFIISCINSKSKGLGGHYHSLIETVKMLSADNKNKIIVACVGNQYPRAFENSSIEKVCFLNFTIQKFRPILTYRKLAKLILEERIQVVHSFDRNALFYARIIGEFHKLPHILTKCGGDNKGYLPYAENIICFSKENYDFLVNNREFISSKIHLIPNRISKFESDLEKIAEIKKAIFTNGDNPIILRISRLGKYYRKTNSNLIELVARLNDDGVKVTGVIVGTIEDADELSYLKNKDFNNNTLFFTDDKFTKNAKVIIDCATLVVGTGRSMMEAMSKSKIGLSPMKNEGGLAIVDSNNFSELFFYNFSERSSINNFNSEENYQKIKQLLTDSDYYSSVQKYTNSVFLEFFDISIASTKYGQIYQSLLPNRKKKYFDFLKHFILQIKVYR